MIPYGARDLARSATESKMSQYARVSLVSGGMSRTAYLRKEMLEVFQWWTVFGVQLRWGLGLGYEMGKDRAEKDVFICGHT